MHSKNPASSAHFCGQMARCVVGMIVDFPIQQSGDTTMIHEFDAMIHEFDARRTIFFVVLCS